MTSPSFALPERKGERLQGYVLVRKCIIAEETVPSPGAVPGTFWDDEEWGTSVQNGAMGSKETSEGERWTGKDDANEQENPSILMAEDSAGKG